MGLRDFTLLVLDDHFTYRSFNAVDYIVISNTKTRTYISDAIKIVLRLDRLLILKCKYF